MWHRYSEKAELIEALFKNVEAYRKNNSNSIDSNPTAADSDGDLTDDGEEVSQGSNPNDDSDGGNAPHASDLVDLTLTVGDHSQSESEIYEMTVSGERTVRLNSGGYGNVETQTFTFKRGNSYTVAVTHVGSSRETPDYDYTATVEVADAAQTASAMLVNEPTKNQIDWVPGDPAEPPVALVVMAATSTAADGVLIEDPQGILGVHTESSSFFADGKSVSVKVIKAEIKSIEFTRDHGVMSKTPTSGSEWDDSWVPFESPEWVAEPSRNNPISQTMGTTISANITVSVLPSDVPFSLIGTGQNNYMSFNTESVTSSGDEQVVAVTANGILPGVVGILNEGIQWKIVVGGVDLGARSSGNHKIYVTYGTPAGSAITEKRVNEVCQLANGLSTISSCAEAIFNGLENKYELNGDIIWGPFPIWLLHDQGEVSQCPGLADYLNKHFQMLGLGAGQIMFCHANANGTYSASTNIVDSATRVIANVAGHNMPTSHDDYNSEESLIHWDASTPPGANAFEATCYFNSSHYALGVDVFSSAEEVVEGSFESISWEYVIVTDWGPPIIGGWDTCTEVPWVEAP